MKRHETGVNNINMRKKKCLNLNRWRTFSRSDEILIRKYTIAAGWNHQLPYKTFNSTNSSSTLISAKNNAYFRLRYKIKVLKAFHF